MHQLRTIAPQEDILAHGNQERRGEKPITYHHHTPQYENNWVANEREGGLGGGGEREKGRTERSGHSAGRTYREQTPAHLHPRLLIGLEPPLRSERVGVRPVHAAVSVQHPRVDADDGAGGDTVAVDDGAVRGGGAPLEDGACVRVDAEGLLDYGVPVLPRRGEGSVTVGTGSSTCGRSLSSFFYPLLGGGGELGTGPQGETYKNGSFDTSEKGTKDSGAYSPLAERISSRSLSRTRSWRAR